MVYGGKQFLRQPAAGNESFGGEKGQEERCLQVRCGRSSGDGGVAERGRGRAAKAGRVGEDSPEP